ncbi:hypothetical protein SEA_GILGAMESH_31 [Streptomyces phage Gilgamesh]|uniref:Uncharacterized protein n=1 Tax=Streptomyces phage Gilgamesh TaxID=2599890 RepID=A0A5J6TQY8_9CAUD|nr:hypothetical protein QEH35_gp031 [Streptomyces phage Gilgamesh]QFG13223.1 hypothetical protein SEA_GILGAMESH_31 [Streptomyces phage Gilgamesh]
MTAPGRRASDLEVLVPLGWDVDASPDIVRRYEEAPDLPGPIQGQSKDGMVLSAECPQCQKTIAQMDQDSILASDPDAWFAGNLPAPFGDCRTVAHLITLGDCGHAFRILPGQTIAVMREQAA